MRLAFVVPRYGEDIVGGAETLCRAYAERLAVRGHRIEVLTTCARDHVSWRNDLPWGDSLVRGVTVRRHRVTATKDWGLMAGLHARIDAGFPLSRAEQEEWLRNSGHSEELLAAVDAAAARVDGLVFLPYLFPSTVFGVGLHPARSLVIPCLHDEVYARFEPVQAALRAARGVLFNTAAEADLATRLLGAAPPSRVVGLGIDPPGRLDPEGFRRRRGITGEVVAYAGRRERAKNFPLLVEWATLAARGLSRLGPLGLVAMGGGAVEIPGPAAGLVTDLGTVSEAEKLDALSAALAVAQLSVQESFSITLLEGFACGVPGIVHAGCAVTVEHCRASGAGLWVASAEEFAVVLDRLRADPPLRAAMGRAGRRYALEEHAWPRVVDRLESALTELLG